MSMKDGEKDRGQLLSIFSAEVWLHILGNVKNGADFQRINNSSPYFRTLLQPRAVEVLFPEVLKILLQQHPQPFDAKELLPLREVCHAWKSGVETALHDPNFWLLSASEQEERQDLVKSYCFRNDAPDLGTYQKFYVEEDFTKFQEHFQEIEATAQSNPFFCHAIHLMLPQEPPYFALYLRACLEFLQIYGVHVRYSTIDVDFTEQNLQVFSAGLQRILALMPNLRVCDFGDELTTAKPVLPEMPRALEELLTSMPQLKHLQKISVDGLPLRFMKALVQKNPQVNIVSDTCGERERVQFYLEQMPNLTRLEVQLTEESAFEAFENAEILNCQLSTLHIDDNWGKSWLGEIGLQRLFSMLEARFSATLTELRLGGEFKAAQVTGLTPRLPNLKKFAFIMRAPIIPLDFILSLQDTLEELTVGAYGYPRCRMIPAGGGLYRGPPSAPFRVKEAKRQERTIKLYEFWVELQKSNVWVLFPKLKRLRTEGYGRPCLAVHTGRVNGRTT